MKKLSEHVAEMRVLAKHLVKFNYPLGSVAAEDAVNMLKFREITVDGYELVVHFSRSDYGDHYVETFQTWGKYTPFLPFALVCKLAKNFLGVEHLSLAEIIKESRKIYCWTVVLDKVKNKAMESNFSKDSKVYFYNELEYTQINPQTVTFY